MRKQGVWGVAASLALSLAASAVQADEGGTSSRNGLSGTDADSPKPATATQVRVTRQQEEARQALEDYLRRQEVVDRLVEIATHTNNPALEKKARQLEERARAIFTKKSPRSAAPSLVEPEAPPTRTRTAAPRREEP